MITVDVVGVPAFLFRLEALDDAMDQVVIDAGTFAAERTVTLARPDVPRVTGAAASSLRVVDFEDGGAAVGGSSAVPYYGWLEFGGYAGRRHSVYREVEPEGRYLRPAYARAAAEIEHHMGELVRETVREVDLS